jgi:hypothetical protein
MATYLLLVMLGFQLKHFLADYVLQRPFMFAGKANMRALGGYAHAGVHIAGSAIVLLLAGAPLTLLAWLLPAEFVVHYLIDFAKSRLGRGVTASGRPSLYWAQHGLDQMLHHSTYAVMIGVLVATRFP